MKSKSLIIFCAAILGLFLISNVIYAKENHNDDLLNAGKTVKSNTNPHYSGKYCEECHLKTPDKDRDTLLKFGGDLNQLCSSCHNSTAENYIHPVGVAPSEEKKTRIPSEFPLDNGKLSCMTCHDISLQCQDNGLAPLNRKFLRDDPKAICYRCHDKSKFRKLNPHEQLTETGEIIPDKCLYCHVEKPDEKNAAFEDIKLIGNLKLLCRRCHKTADRHPSGIDHFIQPSHKTLNKIKELEARFGTVLPLDYDGKITCVTCHNPHDKGVIPAERKGSKGAGEKFKHRIPQVMCQACHGMLSPATIVRSSDSIMIEAINKGDMNAIENLIKNGINANANNRYGDTALMHAANNGHIEAVKLLLKGGARVNEKNKYGITALMYAANKGLKNIAGVLIENGANTTAKNKYGDTAVMYAVNNGHTGIAGLLLDRGARLDNMDISKALLQKAEEGKTDMVRLLIKNGADVNAKTGSGNTALMLAAINNHTDIVGTLLDHESRVNAKNEHGDTAVIYALNNDNKNIARLLFERKAQLDDTDLSKILTQKAEEGKTAIVKLLIEKGADKDMKSWTSHTALMLAVINNHPDTLRMLLDKDAQVDIKDKQGKTALIHAAGRGNTIVIKLLLQKNAGVNIKDKKGRTALMYAAAKGHTGTIKLLLNRNVRVDIKDREGKTALMYAVSRGYEHIVKLLIKKGSLSDAKENDDVTTLMFAIKKGYTNIVKLLIDNGARVNAANKHRSTPLMYAASIGYDHMVRLLLSKGASVNMLDKYGNTALMYAASRGYEKIVKLLLDKGARVNTKTMSGYTALMLAVKNDKSVTAMLLKDAGAIE